VLHRRGVDDDVDVGHRIAQAVRIADVAGEEPAPIVVDAALRGGEARLIIAEQSQSGLLYRKEVILKLGLTHQLSPLVLNRGGNQHGSSIFFSSN
jgi:hypothetical protein